jgi:hypothetical protein
MRLVSAAAVSALLAACAHVPPATQSPPAAAAALSPAPAGVAYFAGTWTARARDPATGSEVLVDYRVEPAPGGAWLKGTAEGPDVRATDVWGRDPATGGVMRAIFDSSGVYALVRGAGWQGDTLVLEGDVQQSGGAVLRVRETIRRQGPDAFEAVWEAFRDGAWVAYSIEQVTRRRDA